LDFEGLVKTASTLKILLFMLVVVALIIMRESKIRNYRPKFKSPLYPFIHIAGIIGFLFLIVQMGTTPIIIVCGFISFSFLWYWFYARDKIWREYTLLHVLERATGQKSTGYLVDEELREILIQRDQLEEERFEEQIRKCEVIDLYKYMQPDKFALLIAEKLTNRIGIPIEKLYKFLIKREKDSNVVIHPGIAVVSHMIKGRDKFEIIIVRSKMGMILSDNFDPIRAFFVIVATPDKKNLHLHTLMWLIQIAEQADFEDEWIEARGVEELRDIIIKAWKKKGEF
jgi:mannitol/fructose-specific phosphotransferase system IIA component (Ntr-type)